MYEWIRNYDLYTINITAIRIYYSVGKVLALLILFSLNKDNHMTMTMHMRAKEESWQTWNSVM